MRQESRISDELRELNQELEDHPIRGFRLRWDEDMSGPVADVLYELPDSESPWPMETLDTYCEQAATKLDGLVLFTYCDFRTPATAAKELSDRDDPAWIPLDRAGVGGGVTSRSA